MKPEQRAIPQTFCDIIVVLVKPDIVGEGYEGVELVLGRSASREQARDAFLELGQVLGEPVLRLLSGPHGPWANVGSCRSVTNCPGVAVRASGIRIGDETKALTLLDLVSPLLGDPHGEGHSNAQSLVDRIVHDRHVDRRLEPGPKPFRRVEDGLAVYHSRILMMERVGTKITTLSRDRRHRCGRSRQIVWR